MPPSEAIAAHPQGMVGGAVRQGKGGSSDKIHPLGQRRDHFLLRDDISRKTTHTDEGQYAVSDTKSVRR